jgi:Zn-dependent protease with chaperone function
MPLDASISIDFRKNVSRSIFSIFLFAFVFIALIILSIAFAIASAYLGFMIIIAKPMWLTLLIGAGLVAMGILVIIFLFRFITVKYKTDTSGLTEITREDQPDIFAALDEIVQKVDTNFPGRVYLSQDVNASVFYDSSFWSMFLPVKKNLVIGMGLVNAVSIDELKAILAHEFGHFSQRSMKVGSYVYHVNKVLFNLLSDNSSYNNLVETIARLHGVIAIFVNASMKIIAGIRWILIKMYNYININYMALSREMEFHADEVAARAIGSKPLMTSLLRINLADQAYNSVIEYYNNRIVDAVVARNIYPQQEQVMHFIAKENKIPFQNGFPVIEEEYLSQYNKSKLVLTNQWASHPSIQDRVARLEELNIAQMVSNGQPAVNLFKGYATLQVMLTNELFSSVAYEKEITPLETDEFFKTYTTEHKSASFDPVYNGYYDNKNIEPFDLSSTAMKVNDHHLSVTELYCQAIIEKVYTMISMEGDLRTIKELQEGKSGYKTFDYDGLKYKVKESNDLIIRLEKEIDMLKNDIKQHDLIIFNFFLQMASGKGRESDLMNYYALFFKADLDWDRQTSLYNKCIQEAAFIYETTPFDIIESKLLQLKESENELKSELRAIIENDNERKLIDAEMKESFELYLSKDWTYFINPNYDDASLEKLGNALKYYQQAMSKNYYFLKKQLLDFQAELIK